MTEAAEGCGAGSLGERPNTELVLGRMLVALEGYKWVLTRRLGFARLEVGASAQNTIKGLDRRYCPVWTPTSISSDQGTHSTAHSVQQWAERFHIRWTNRVAYLE